MKRKRLYILAPNDRFNYGDLLFPYVLTHYLEDSVDSIIYCSTSKSDLSALGGYPTEDFNVLYHLDNAYDNYLIVAGGECLLVRWCMIISFISSAYRKLWNNIHKFRIHKFINEKIVNGLIDFSIVKIYGVKTEYPFTVGKNELPGFVNIMYNSVGGAWLNDKEKIVNRKRVLNILKSVAYISVRDQIANDTLNNCSVENVLTPDSAILLSKIFSSEDVYMRVSEDIAKFNVDLKYVFFEVNEGVYQLYKEDIIKQLYQIIDDGYMIVLCPIGTALGHRDDVALYELYKRIGSSDSFFVRNPSIWDIMWLIINSNIYVGTSLHGVITAMSYEVPFLSYAVVKTKAYISCWYKEGVDSHFCNNISEMYEKFNQSLLMKYDSSRQINLAKCSMDKMLNIIRNH